MTDYISEVKKIPHNDSKIYTLLSDLSNFQRIQERIPQDKIKDFSFDTDACSFTVNPVGFVEFRIIDREPNKTIKFSTTNSPIPLMMWIQLKQVDENETKMKMTVRADLNSFIKPMVSKLLQEAIDKIAEMIASLPYE